jgi:hypothetical protein
MKAIGVLVSVTMVAWLAGCGGEKAASSGGERPDAAASAASGEPATVTCETLLPRDEIRTVLGAEPDKVQEDARPGSTACWWYYTPPGAVQRVFFQVVISGASDMWLPMRDSEARNDSRTPAAAAGIGDEAYTWVGQADYRRLYVRQGRKTLVVRGPVALPALAAEPAMAKLAATLLGRF